MYRVKVGLEKPGEREDNRPFAEKARAFVARPRISPASRAKYSQTLARWQRIIGGEVTSESLQNYADKRLSERKSNGVPISAQSVRGDVAVIKSMAGNPDVDKVSINGGKEKKKRVTILPVEAFNSIVALAPADCRDFLVGYYYSGARSSELLALTWKDIRRDSVMLPNLKTRNTNADAHREVPLHPRLKSILAERKAAGLFSPFPPLKSRSYLQKQFATACLKAGIKLSRLHDLRHAFCTRACEGASAADLAEVSQLMGHSDLSTTALYISSDPARRKAIIQRMA